MTNVIRTSTEKTGKNRRKLAHHAAIQETVNKGSFSLQINDLAPYKRYLNVRDRLFVSPPMSKLFRRQRDLIATHKQLDTIHDLLTDEAFRSRAQHFEIPLSCETASRIKREGWAK